MFVSLRLLTLPGGRIRDAAGIAQALGAACGGMPGVTGCWAAPVADTAVINAGHVVLRLTHVTEAEALRLPLCPDWAAQVAPLIEGATLTTIGYRITRCTSRDQGAGIWRALIFGIFPNRDPALVRQLEDATLMLPRYVSEIRSYALSNVAYVEGAKCFHYVWEQEFDGIADLTGPYMTHPAHWGVADAFFDAEYPEYIVDPYLIQVVGRIGGSILSAAGNGQAHGA